MPQTLIPIDLLFEVTDILGRNIRTTKGYWKKIKEIKHTELRFGIPEVKQTLKNPDEIRINVTDNTILLFAKKIDDYDILIVAVKILNGNGFLATVYQTKTYKKKGEIIWTKPNKK